MTSRRNLTTDDVLHLLSESDSDNDIADWNLSDDSECGEEVDFQAVWETANPLDQTQENNIFEEKFQQLNLV